MRLSRALPAAGAALAVLVCPNIDAVYRQLASYAAKVLNGASAADMPIEQPTTLELVINRRTADTIGVSLPAGVLARADEVIE